MNVYNNNKLQKYSRIYRARIRDEQMQAVNLFQQRKSRVSNAPVGIMS